MKIAILVDIRVLPRVNSAGYFTESIMGDKRKFIKKGEKVDINNPFEKCTLYFMYCEHMSLIILK